MNGSIYTLSREYENCIAVQKDVIAHYRDKLNAARRKGKANEIEKLKSMLRILYDEKSELEEKAVEMRRYLS